MKKVHGMLACLAIGLSTLIINIQPVYSAILCKSVFAEKSGSNKIELPDFLIASMRSDFKHDKNYTVEVKEQSDVRDQCSLGTCHLHAWVSELEQKYHARTGNKVKISTQYLTGSYWMFSALRSLKLLSIPNVPFSALSFTLGEVPTVSKKFISMFGVVPEGAWKPKVDFDKPLFSTRITEYVRNVLSQVKLALDLNQDPAMREKILKAGEYKIYEIFSEVLGNMPTGFEIEGKKYSPATLAHELFPELGKPLVQMISGAKEDQKTIFIKDDDDIIFITSINVIERKVRELLDKGLNVYLGYEHNAAYVDKNTGIMSLSAFNQPELSSPLPRELRFHYNIREGGHAVQIVGYDLDSVTGKVKKWKIKNSWGAEVGDKGYYHMYSDYFRQYVNGIFFDLGSTSLPRPEVTIINEQLSFDF